MQKKLSEQVERLSQDIAENILRFFHEYEERTSAEATIARDADLLECIVQAREYQIQGYVGLKTTSAKKLAEACIHTEPSTWWKGLKIK